MEGSFNGSMKNGDQFGYSLAALGDLDRDGAPDLAVGSPFDGDGGPARGAVRVLFITSNGTVLSHQKISATQGGLNAYVNINFGFSMSLVGDVNGDGTRDLAVGAPFDNDGGPSRGAVWILFLNTTGAVNGHLKISDT